MPPSGSIRPISRSEGGIHAWAECQCARAELTRRKLRYLRNEIRYRDVVRALPRTVSESYLEIAVTATVRCMARTWGAAAMLVGSMVTLAGCGGSAGGSPGSSAAASSPHTATAAAHSAPAKKAATATVAQYASIIAKNMVVLNKSLAELQGSHCDWTIPGRVDVRQGYFTCAIGSLTVGYEAKTLSVELQAANTPAADGYVGPPPKEIATLVKDTKAQADQLGSTSVKAQDCTKTPIGSDCMNKLFKFSANMGFMQSQLAAWGPYLS